MHPYSSIDTIADWKKLRFILSVRSDFHMTDSLLIAVHAFDSRVSKCFQVSLLLLFTTVTFTFHHHHVALVARISLTLSRHSSLSFIAPGRSSGQHPVSSHSCWMYVRAGRPAFARPCVGVHKSTSLMSSSLLLQQCPACLVRLTWIVLVIGGRWPYSWCLKRSFFQAAVTSILLYGCTTWTLTKRLEKKLDVYI